jgi:hypothetical protein
MFRTIRALRGARAGSLAVGIVLVVLIPFLRKLITNKAETPVAEAPTVVPVA